MNFNSDYFNEYPKEDGNNGPMFQTLFPSFQTVDLDNFEHAPILSRVGGLSDGHDGLDALGPSRDELGIWRNSGKDGAKQSGKDGAKDGAKQSGKEKPKVQLTLAELKQMEKAKRKLAKSNGNANGSKSNEDSKKKDSESAKSRKYNRRKKDMKDLNHRFDAELFSQDLKENKYDNKLFYEGNTIEPITSHGIHVSLPMEVLHKDPDWLLKNVFTMELWENELSDAQREFLMTLLPKNTTSEDVKDIFSSRTCQRFVRAIYDGLYHPIINEHRLHEEFLRIQKQLLEKKANQSTVSYQSLNHLMKENRENFVQKFQKTYETIRKETPQKESTETTSTTPSQM